jgi:hypothetical protein
MEDLFDSKIPQPMPESSLKTYKIASKLSYVLEAVLSVDKRTASLSNELLAK